MSKKTGMQSARERSLNKRIKSGAFIMPKCPDCKLPIQKVYIVVQRHYKWLRDIYFCRRCQKLIHREDAILPPKDVKK